MGRLSTEAYNAATKLPLVVVLDNVRSQHNVGAVFRTADAYRVQALYLCGICCCPPNTEIHKTALGAEQTVEYHYYDKTEDAISKLKEQGYTIYAIEIAHDSISLEEAIADHPDRPVALVLGHEVFGVQDSVISLCDACIELPQYGTKHSLNVSVTAGIVIYEWAKGYF